MAEITTHDEERLLTATKRAGDLMESQGLTPDAAIEKVAREQKFGPGEIQMLCYAHNTGRQLAQFQKEASILDKLAEFPLADPENIVAAIYPSQTKTASAPPELRDRHIDYLMPPTWADTNPRPLEKAALDIQRPTFETPTADPIDSMRKRYGNYERIKRAYEQSRQEVLIAEGKLMSKIAGLTEYFQQPGRLAFSDVEKVARTLHGEPATILMTAVHQRLKSKEKRAADVPDRVVKQLIRTTDRPIALVEEAIKAAADVSTKRAEVATKQAAYEKAKEGISGPFAERRLGTAPSRPTSSEKTAFGPVGWGLEVGAIAAGDILAHKATHTQDEDLDRQAKAMFADTDDEIGNIRAESNRVLQKQAFLTSPAMGAFLGNSVGRIVGDGPKTKNDLIEDEWLDLEDPKHLNEMRKIKAHAMLNSMMTDPDSPISGHHPDDVTEKYNEISQLAPRVAEQPAAMKPLLSRQLQGNTQPFEAKEITDIEKGITSTRVPTPNTSLLKDAPDSLLG